MRIVTLVSLAASAVLGLGALFVAKTVMPNSAAAKDAGESGKGVPVVVATRSIKYGDKLNADMLTVVRAPANLAPQGAFQSVAQVLAADDGGAPVALTAMAAREPLLPTKVSGPGARPTVAAEIERGFRAYTIKVSDVSGVGGHALPGDRVDVVLMRDLTPEENERTYVSYVVLQNIRVLGVDLNADLNSQKPASPDNVTLEVSVEDAQKLSVAGTLGTLSLALRRTGEADAATTGVMRTADFLSGGAPAAQFRRVATRSVSRAAPAKTYAILIVEGQPSGRDRTKRPATQPPPPKQAPTPRAFEGSSKFGPGGEG
jgi:pilus assembly protein CpaB